MTDDDSPDQDDGDVPLWKKAIAGVTYATLGAFYVYMAVTAEDEDDDPKLSRDGPGYAILTSEGDIIPNGMVFKQREDAESYKESLETSTRTPYYKHRLGSKELMVVEV